MSSPGRTGPVTAELVVDAALSIIDGEGLEALTMRRLARDLGVEPVTVYRQLPNKQAILAAVAERLWSGSGSPADATGPPEAATARSAPDEGPWRDRVRAMWLTLHSIMLEHPNAIPLIAKGGAYSAAAASGTAGMLDVFRRAGLSPDEAAELLHILSAGVVGFGFAALWSRELRQGGPPEGPAGGPPAPVPAELRPYLERAARWEPGEFARALDIVLAAYGRPTPPARRPPASAP